MHHDLFVCSEEKRKIRNYDTILNPFLFLYIFPYLFVIDDKYLEVSEDSKNFFFSPTPVNFQLVKIRVIECEMKDDIEH